jgi:hypothetical protein
MYLEVIGACRKDFAAQKNGRCQPGDCGGQSNSVVLGPGGDGMLTKSGCRRKGSNSRNDYGNWGLNKPAVQILGDCRETAIDAAWKRI